MKIELVGERETCNIFVPTTTTQINFIKNIEDEFEYTWAPK